MESVTKLLPLSPQPSVLHSRLAPPTISSISLELSNQPQSFLDLPSPSAESFSTNLTKFESLKKNYQNQIKTPTNQDWWKWSTPTINLALKLDNDGIGNYEENFARVDSDFGRKDGKMVGSWRVGAGIGSGMSGRVRIARSTLTGQFAAIKMIQKVKNMVTSAKAGDREIIILKLVEHPNVLRLLDVFETKEHTYLVTEYCSGGELFSYVSENKLSYDLSHDLFCQLIDALAHLHKMGIAHRDIKLENILVVENSDGNLNLKLADLGMAAFQAPGTLLSTSCGSPHYASPEVITGIEYDGPTSDIWSAGIILFALISRSLPFDDENVPQLLANIKRGRYVMKDCITGDARDLISRMLVVKPEHRINMADVRVHQYLTEGGYEAVESALPFPLVLDPPSYHFDTPRMEDIDPAVVDNLVLLCNGEEESCVIESILSSRLSKARVFYTILNNFRTRPYSSEKERELLVAAAKNRPLRGIAPRQARRSLSAPSLATSLNSSCIGLLECDVCHSSNRIRKSHIHSEGIMAIEEMEEKENRPLPTIEIEGNNSEGGDDLLFMIEAGDVAFNFSPYSSSGHSIPASPSNRFLESSPGSVVVENRKGMAEKMKGFFSPVGKNEKVTRPKSPLFGNLLKRSTGYTSLRGVVLPDPLPTPSSPSARFNTTDRMPLSPIENFSSKKMNSPISNMFTSSKNFLKNKRSLITSGSPLMYTQSSRQNEFSAFSDCDTSHSSNDITSMLYSLPPSPSPKTSTGITKKIINRPSPLILSDFKNLELDIKWSETEVSTFSAPEFTWSPFNFSKSRDGVITSALESESTSAGIGSSTIRVSDRIGVGASNRPGVIRKYSDILLDELEKEVGELRKANESLVLQNGLLRQAVDKEIHHLEDRILSESVVQAIESNKD